MQFGLLILTVFLNTSGSMNQELRYDENGHIVFTDVVSTDIGMNQLITNAKSLKDFQMTSEHQFVKDYVLKLYKKRIGKSPDAELTYSLTIDLKNNRYRYVFTDFIYHPLERNRYGRFERVRNSALPLETVVNADAKRWETHNETILKRISSSVDMLYKKLSHNEAPKEQTVNLKDDW